MRCPKCGAWNPKDKKFCGNCGNSMPLGYVLIPSKLKCPDCGAENPPGKRFCGDCGGTLLLSEEKTFVDEPTSAGELSSVNRGKVRTGYLIGGGLTAAIFFGLFFWANNYTYTERVWRDLGYGFGYWETVTRTIDPAIQAFLLVIAIIGLVAVAYGLVSRK